MSLNPLRALVHHVTVETLVHHVTVSSKILTNEMERHQSHEMRGVAWFCEISLTPAWLQYAGIPHPIRPPGGGYPRRAVSGRGNPRDGSLFRPSPHPGPWEVSPLGEGTFASSPVSLHSAWL